MSVVQLRLCPDGHLPHASYDSTGTLASMPSTLSKKLPHKTSIIPGLFSYVGI